jgi:hypothetical protein
MAVRNQSAQGSSSAKGSDTDASQATVHVFVFQTEKDGDRKALDGVEVLVFTDARAKTPVRLEPQTYCSGKDGPIKFRAQPGYLRIVPEPSQTVGSQVLHTELSKGFLFEACAGQLYEIPIAYELGRAEVTVSACVVAASGKTSATLPNVTFSLYQGATATGAPLEQETTTASSTEKTFGDLKAGYYTLTAALKNQARQGVRLELVRPTGGAHTVYVCEGQPLDLRGCFCFKPCTGEVTGRVVDAECGDGVEGVQVQLAGQGSPGPTKTRSAGEFAFPDVPPGNYTIQLYEERFGVGGVKWESAQPGQQFPITVSPWSPTPPVVLQVQRDIPRILIEVTDTGGDRHRHAVVEIYDTFRKRVDTVVVGEDGKLTWIAPCEGTYYVAPKLSHDGAPAQMYPVTVQSPGYVRFDLNSPAVGADQRNPPLPAAGAVAESVHDATAYPLLTEEVSFPTPAPRSYGAGAAGTGSIGQTIESALRDVLGWRPKASDPRGFTAALTQSFNLKWVEGHTEATWVPRNYAVAVQADMGAITGAQASIYARAKVALDQSLPLLAGLSSLRTDILPEDQETIRSIVRSELTQLVNELGQEGGPRVARVDELFGYLLGLQPLYKSPLNPTPLTAEQLVTAQELTNDSNKTGLPATPNWPNTVPPPIGWPAPITTTWPPPSQLMWPTLGTHLGELGLRFGMERGNVNTIEDEQDLTNFIILVDYVTGLWQTWIAQRPYFNRLQTGYEPYLGTQLVLVSRDLAVVAESVQEVNFTMDSVFLGPAERQTLQLKFYGTIHLLPMPTSSPQPYPFPPQTSPLFVAELLDWIDRFTSEEGPRLIQDAGKDGVAALKPTLDSLRKFARGALLMAHGGVQDPVNNPIPKGYRTPRVQRAVRELADSLDQAYFDAYPIQPLQLTNE